MTSQIGHLRYLVKGASFCNHGYNPGGMPWVLERLGPISTSGVHSKPGSDELQAKGRWGSRLTKEVYAWSAQSWPPKPAIGEADSQCGRYRRSAGPSISGQEVVLQYADA